MSYKDLAVASYARTDADRGDLQSSGDLLGNLRRHAFDNHGERTRLFRGSGIFQKLGLFSLDPEAAEAPHRLRSETDVSHDRDISLGDGGDGGRAADTAFE